MNIANVMKQAQAMQDKMKRIEDEIQASSVEASVGGGMVSLTMNGGHEVSKVAISPEVMNDREMLQDLVLSAVNEAVRKVKELREEKMKGAMSGMGLPNIPGLGGLF